MDDRMTAPQSPERLGWRWLLVFGGLGSTILGLAFAALLFVSEAVNLAYFGPSEMTMETPPLRNSLLVTSGLGLLLSIVALVMGCLGRIRTAMKLSKVTIVAVLIVPLATWLAAPNHSAGLEAEIGVTKFVVPWEYRPRVYGNAPKQRVELCYPGLRQPRGPKLCNDGTWPMTLHAPGREAAGPIIERADTADGLIESTYWVEWDVRSLPDGTKVPMEDLARTVASWRVPK